MPEVWVANASPVIHLSKIGEFRLLERLPARLVIPTGVVEEVTPAGKDDTASKALSNAKGFELVDVPAIHASVAGWDLGRGESEVLTWALANPGAVAILDDHQARSAAGTLHVPVRGTLGLLVVAKRRGLVGAVRPLVDALRCFGLYLDDPVVGEILRLSGEAND